MSDECKDARCNAMVATIRLRMHDEAATEPGKPFAAPVLAERLKDLAKPIHFILHEAADVDDDSPATQQAQAALAEIVGLANALARTR